MNLPDEFNGERLDADGYTLDGTLHTAVEHATGEVFNDPISPQILEVLYRGGWVVVRKDPLDAI